MTADPPGSAPALSSVTFEGQPGVDYVDKPTFVVIPAEFQDGTIEWIKLKIDIDGTQVKVTVNDIERLSLTETKAAPVAGDIGLFVDIGSESFFSNLKIITR